MKGFAVAGLINRLVLIVSILAALAVTISFPAAAQMFPTPSKALCLGDPPATVSLSTCNQSNGVTTVNANVPVYFAVSVNANATSPFVILDSLPAGFTYVDVECTSPGANGVGAISSVSFAPPANTPGPTNLTIGSFTMATPGALQCFIKGYFTSPGANLYNKVQIIGDHGQQLSSPFQLNFYVNPLTTFPSNLSVAKTATWEDMPLPVDVSVSPQYVDYTIVVTNNGPYPVYLGQAFSLQDYVNASSTGVPLQAFIDTTTPITCIPPSGGDCVAPTTGSGGTALTNPPLNLQNWSFPTSGAGSNGYLPVVSVGGPMTIKYRVKVQRDPDIFCAKGQEALHNEARIVFNNLVGINFPDPNPLDNVSQSVDVPVNTGQPIDPSCALPIPGPISILKQQSPQVSGAPPYAWNSAIPYGVTIKNTDPNPITVQLRDRAMPWWGTPNFSATLASWSCAPSGACPALPTIYSPQTFNTYALAETIWEAPSVTIPGAVGNTPGVVTLNIALNYQVLNLCDSFANGDNQIWNEGRADYTYQGQSYVAESDAPTVMAPVTPQCQFDVHKSVLDTDKVVYGTQISYIVRFHNAGAQAVDVGTVFDAMRLQQPNYAAQLSYAGNYSCEISGSVSGGGFPIFPNTAALAGAVYNTPQPSQGTRIFSNVSGSVVHFGPNSELKCQVNLTFQRPPAGAPFCQSSVDPRLENFAVMDVTHFYNPYTPFPPSQTYNPNTPLTTEQPPTNTASSWRMVDVKLPKCYNFTLNKSSTPNFSWTPGGPSPINYTITLKNVGDTLNWHDFRLTDMFATGSTTPWPAAPTLLNIQAPNLGANCTGFSGSNASTATAFSYGIGLFPAGCTISPTFSVAIPAQYGSSCNDAMVKLEPNAGPGTDTDDWYANDPTLTFDSHYCVPILETVPVNVKKAVDNQAGAVLPANFLYPIDVGCTTPNPNGGASVLTTYHVQVADGGLQTIPHVPVTSVCVVQELTAQLPPLSASHCVAPMTPQWVIPPTYVPASSVTISAPGPDVVGVQNAIKCVMPPVKTLTIVKVLQPSSLATTLPSTAQFPVTAQCSPSPTQTLHMTPASLTQTIANVPVGAHCVVSEAAPSFTPPHCSWASPTISPASIIVGATGAGPTATVTNTLKCDPDLAIVKTGPVPDPNYPGVFDFTLTVTSVGGPFTAAPNSITVSDAVYGGAGALVNMTASPGWNSCPGFTCTYTGPGPTATPQVLGVITVRFQPLSRKPYLNCAQVRVVPHAGESDWNAANDMNCVNVGNLPNIDLAVEKTGPTPATWPGQYQFEIIVRNVGAPFTLPAGATLDMHDFLQNVSHFGGILQRDWTAGWAGCPYTATTDNCVFSSTTPMSVATNQVLGKFHVFYHPSATDKFQNCASIGFHAGVPLVDVNPSNNLSCVTVDATIINNGGSNKIDVPPVLACDPTSAKPDGDACVCLYPGMKSESATSCACPEGTSLKDGVGCAPQKRCPEGTVQKGEACAKPTAACDATTAKQSGSACACLYPGMKPTSPSACACPAGTTLQEGVGCAAQKRCPPPMTRSSPDAACACPEGTVQKGDACVKPTAVCDASTAKQAGAACACLYPNMKPTSPTSCACPVGTTLKPGVGCAPEAHCPATQTEVSPGKCGCPPGAKLRGEECVRGH